MFILGLQGSPRKKGNTNFLLKTVLEQAGNRGAQTRVLHASDLNVAPCRGCGFCEKKGVCAHKPDDMASTVFPLLRRADIVLLASPIYFYNVPGQLKLLIDRTQSLWSRKYRLGLEDPGRRYRRGVLLAVGATKGKNLFDGTVLTARYFFDAIGASYAGDLTYRRIENPHDMEKHPNVMSDTASLADSLQPLFDRRKILFACRENACRSQMASAFARFYAGDRIDVLSAGSTPAEKIDPQMEAVMAEKGIDMAYRIPRPIDTVAAESRPDVIITMGCGEECPYTPGTAMENWDLPDPAGQSVEFMRSVRDEIEERVRRLIQQIDDSTDSFRSA